MNLHAFGAVASWVLGDNHAGFPAAFAQFAQAVSPAAARAAFDAMWQGAAVALSLFLSLRLAPRVSAAHRFAAWAAGFALVAALPLLPFAAHLFAGAGGPASVSAGAVSPRPWLELDSRWALAIAVLWLAGSVLRLGDLVFHTLRLRGLWKSAIPVAEGSIDAESLSEGSCTHPSGAKARTHFARIMARLKPCPCYKASCQPSSITSRRVEICTTNRLDRPSVIGFFAPRILIPEWLYARLTPQELEQVVLHEAEHLCRHDDWTNLIQKFALVLFPLNPALAWIERRLCREREMACDEGVVRRTQAPRAYAACLASLAERGMERDQERELARRAEALSLAAWRRRPELVHRVHGILWRKPALSPAASRVLLGVVGCGLLAGSVELARCPQTVAFVAVAQPEQMAQADAVNIDRATYTPVSTSGLAVGASGVHMVQAKGILPASRNEAMVSAPAQARRAVVRRARADNEIASRDSGAAMPHETLLRAGTVSEASDRAVIHTSDAAQFVVLTAYERVQRLPQNGREIADYDTGSAADGDSAPQLAPGARRRPAAAPAPQIIVMRLILRIEPANPGQANGSGIGSDQGSPSERVTNSKPVNSNPLRQPAVIPFGNGWLVLQL